MTKLRFSGAGMARAGAAAFVLLWSAFSARTALAGSAPADLSALLESLGFRVSAGPVAVVESVRPPLSAALRYKAVPRPTDPDKRDDIEGWFDWDWQRLTYPAGTVPPGDWRGRAMQHVKKNVAAGVPKGVLTFPAPSRGGREALAVVPPSTTSWTEMGPKPLDSTGTTNNAYRYGVVSGRANAIAFADASTAYAGGPVGGLWKTTNCCSATTTWAPLWDASTFPAQSVGAITVDSTNPNVVYVGTGDSQVPAYDMYGNGIYKSTDAGASWTQYGAGLMSPYSSTGAPGASCCTVAPDQNIKTIVVDPRNPNTVIAGASYGVFISFDAGVNWAQWFVVDPNSATFNTSAQRVTSILVDGSTNPSTMYVAIGYPYTSTRRPGLVGGANGVYKAPVPSSGSGGVLPGVALVATGWPAGTGNGGVTSNVGRVELAWDAGHTHIYAHVATYGYNGGAVGDTLGIWHTANGGTGWNQLTNTAAASWKDCANGAESQQDWYDLYIAVDPNNDKTLYSGRVNLWKLTVNGTYTAVATSSASGTTCPTNAPCDISAVYATGCTAYGHIHPDEHGFAFVPGTNPSRFVAANDGGLFLGDGNATATSYTSLNGPAASGGISTNQFYAGQLGADFANTSGTSTQYLFGGMQDNGSATWDSSQGNAQWTARSTGGDGFFTAFDPIGGTISAGNWATEYTNGSVSCSSTGANGPFGSATGGANCSPRYGASEREDWSTPFIVDQWNCTNATCGNMVLGTNFAWASTNFGGSWTKVAASDLTKGSGDAIAVNVAMNNPGSVILGTSDGNVQWSNNVFTGTSCTAALANTAGFSCSANKNATWVDLTGANAVLPNRVMNGVAFDPTTNLVFYAAVGGFNTNTVSTPGHVFRGTCSASPCTTANVTWVDKSGTPGASGSLPDIPFASVQPNPNNVKQVFAGSYLGVYYTDDITANPPVWNRFQAGMPNTRVQFLAVDRGPAASPRASTTLAAFTYGRGAYALQLAAPCPKPSAPAAPTFAGVACTTQTVSWSAVSGATSYDVWRASGGSCGGAVKITGTPVTGTSFADSGLTPGTQYSYYVTANNSCGTSPNGSCASSTTSPVPSAPAAPTFSNVSCSTQTVSWATVAGATSYDVWRATGASCSGAVKITATPVAGTSYGDSGLSSGTQYSYYVTANNACGASAAGTCASSATTSGPTPPAGVTASATAPNQITVQWSTVAGATQYVVYRSAGACPGGTYAQIATVTAPGLAYQDNAVVGGLTYSYTVSAVVGCEGARSSCASAAGTGLCTAAPTFAGLGSATASSAGTCGISLAWSAGNSNCGASVTYSVYRSTVSGFTPTVATRVASGVTGTSYLDTAGLSPATTYYYVVRAVDSSTAAEDANTARNTNGVATPSGCAVGPVNVPAFTATSTGTAANGQNVLEWLNPSSGPAGMTTLVNFRTDQYPTGPADPLATAIPACAKPVAIGAVDGCTHTGLTNGTTYYYALWVRN